MSDPNEQLLRDTLAADASRAPTPDNLLEQVRRRNSARRNQRLAVLGSSVVVLALVGSTAAWALFNRPTVDGGPGHIVAGPVHGQTPSCGELATLAPDYGVTEILAAYTTDSEGFTAWRDALPGVNFTSASTTNATRVETPPNDDVTLCVARASNLAPPGSGGNNGNEAPRADTLLVEITPDRTVLLGLMGPEYEVLEQFRVGQTAAVATSSTEENLADIGPVDPAAVEALRHQGIDIAIEKPNLQPPDWLVTELLSHGYLPSGVSYARVTDHGRGRVHRIMDNRAVWVVTARNVPVFVSGPRPIDGQGVDRTHAIGNSVTFYDANTGKWLEAREGW